MREIMEDEDGISRQVDTDVKFLGKEPKKTCDNCGYFKAQEKDKRFDDIWWGDCLLGDETTKSSYDACKYWEKYPNLGGKI